MSDKSDSAGEQQKSMGTAITGEVEAAEKARRLRPNYFVAVEVNSELIRQNVVKVHQSLLEANSLMEKCLIPVEQLHITLLVVRLSEKKEENPMDLQKAELAMTAAVESIGKYFTEERVEQLGLNFSGLDSFGLKVLFGQMEADSNRARLEKMAQIVRETFNDHQILLPDVRAFNPHLTLAKLKLEKERKGVRHHRKKWEKVERLKIKTEYYEDHRDIQFGSQPIQSIQFVLFNEGS